MQRFVFITLMNYYPWGGSEELWQRTALLARLKGLSVEAHVFDSSKGHPKIRELIDAGVSVFFRKDALSRFDRIIRKAKLKFLNPFDRDNYWQRNLKDRNSIHVISGGTTFDCLHFPALFEHIRARDFRFFYISQHHPEHSSLTLEQIEAVRGIFKISEKVFFVSQRNLNIVQRQLAFNVPNAEVVFNPINVSREYLPLGNSPESLRVACVARLECANKGQDILFEVLNSDKWKGRNIVITLYGKGPDKDYLKLLAEHYKINRLIAFAGHVDDIKTIWENNDFLIMPSLAEGTPLVLMEAMACGRSAVLTDVGGNTEWITEGYNGFIAPAPTPKLFDEALERMWQNRHRCAEMGKIAFETFAGKFPKDAVEYFYDRITEIYSHRQVRES